MKGFPRLTVCLALVCLVFALGACAKESSSEEAIPNPIPAKSKFAKIQLGWSMQRVHDTIGKPTDTRSYTTGKAFIPFYFGSDNARVEDLYKAEGRVIYSGGAGVGNQGFTVLKIIYDPEESGYNDKTANPNGPQKAEPAKKTKKKKAPAKAAKSGS